MHNPSFEEWKENILPERCRFVMEMVCLDIIKHGENTYHKGIYAAIYEMIEADIEDQHRRALDDAAETL